MTDRIGVTKLSPATNFYLAADELPVTPAMIAGNYTVVRCYLRCVNAGNTTSKYLGAGAQIGRIDGIGEFGRRSANPFLPSGYGAGALRWNAGNYDVVVPHNSDGSRTIVLRMILSYGTIYQELTAGLALTTLPRAPGAPTLNSITDIKPVEFLANFTAPASVGGGPIIDYTVQYSTSDTFTSPQTETGAASPILCDTGLVPSTFYYVRVRANNAYGSSAWSNVLTFSTAAAGAPHLGVVPKWDGSGFHLVLSPPFSVGSVDDYTVHRTVSGPAAPAPTDVVVASTGLGFDTLSLAPGQTVTYQALATVGGTDTGYTDSLSLSYASIAAKAPRWPVFDGSFVSPAPMDDQTTAWTGTAGSSSSEIMGSHPKGWRTFDEGAADLATGVVSRINKTVALQTPSGTFDVVAVFGTEQTTAGVRVGTSLNSPGLAEVFPSIEYFGLMKVMTDVPTSLALEIEWFDENENLISRKTGIAQTTESYVAIELRVSDLAPEGAAYAAVSCVDVTGDDWAPGSLRFAASAQLTASSSYSYIDGSLPEDPLYEFEWMGVPNASTSIRLTKDTADANTLQDPEDDPLPAPPRPPVVEEGAILTEVVWRRYVALVDASDVRKWVTSVPTLLIQTDEAEERQVRIRYWRNPFNLDVSSWSDVGAEMTSEQIVSYIPTESVFVIDGVAERAYVLTGDGDTRKELSADHLLYGEAGGPASWPILNCGDSYVITFDVPVDAVEGNLTMTLNLTDRML